MAQNYAASVQGVCIRLSRLDATGAPIVGLTGSYVMDAFIRTSFTPEYEEGERITEKNAQGGVCVDYKAPDTLQRVTLELAICNPDPEVTELLAGGTLLTDTATTPNNIGYAAPEAGVDSNPNGCGLEVWSYAITGSKRAAVNPFFHWIFPKVDMRPTGDRTFENGLLANVFSGTGTGNAEFGGGPATGATAWPYPAVAGRPYAYSRVPVAPTGVNGYVAVTA